MCGFCTPGFVVATVAVLENIRTQRESNQQRSPTATSAAAARSCRIMEAAMKAKQWRRG